MRSSKNKPSPQITINRWYVYHCQMGSLLLFNHIIGRLMFTHKKLERSRFFGHQTWEGLNHVDSPLWKSWALGQPGLCEWFVVENGWLLILGLSWTHCVYVCHAKFGITIDDAVKFCTSLFLQSHRLIFFPWLIVNCLFYRWKCLFLGIPPSKPCCIPRCGNRHP